MGNFISQKRQDSLPDHGTVPGAIGSVIDWPRWGQTSSARAECVPAKTNSHEYATLIYDADDTDTDTESGIGDSRTVIIQGTFDSWKDALHNLWVQYGIFEHGYVGILKNGIYQKDRNPEIKKEWARLLAYHEFTKQLEAVRRARAYRREAQQLRLEDLEQTIDIIEAPDKVPLGHEKLAYARRHLHYLLDHTYNETLWEEISPIALNIHEQIFRCRFLPDYANKAQHGLPSQDSEEQLSGNDPDSDEE